MRNPPDPPNSPVSLFAGLQSEVVVVESRGVCESRLRIRFQISFLRVSADQKRIAFWVYG